MKEGPNVCEITESLPSGKFIVRMLGEDLFGLEKNSTTRSKFIDIVDLSRVGTVHIRMDIYADIKHLYKLLGEFIKKEEN